MMDFFFCFFLMFLDIFVGKSKKTRGMRDMDMIYVDISTLIHKAEVAGFFEEVMCLVG